MTFQRTRGLRPAFTLVELVATIAVMAALSTVAASTMLTALDGYLSASTRSQLHIELSMAMDRIVRELQNIRIDASAADVAPDIESMSAASIAWNDDSGLSMSGSQLLFNGDGSSPAPLLEDVSAFQVRAFDEGNVQMGASLSGSGCDAIRRLEVTISMQRSGVTESLRTRVFLRCTMEGAS